MARLLRGIKHAGKEKHSFEFEITIHEAIGLPHASLEGSSTNLDLKYYVSWSRGTKVVQTSKAHVADEPAPSGAIVRWNEQISLTCSMFPNDKNGLFDDKRSRLAIKEVQKRSEKTLFYIPLNLSEFAKTDGADDPESRVLKMKSSNPKEKSETTLTVSVLAKFIGTKKNAKSEASNAEVPPGKPSHAPPQPPAPAASSSKNETGPVTKASKPAKPQKKTLSSYAESSDEEGGDDNRGVRDDQEDSVVPSLDVVKAGIIAANERVRSSDEEEGDEDAVSDSEIRYSSDEEAAKSMVNNWKVVRPGDSAGHSEEHRRDREATPASSSPAESSEEEEERSESESESDDDRRHHAASNRGGSLERDRRVETERIPITPRYQDDTPSSKGWGRKSDTSSGRMSGDITIQPPLDNANDYEDLDWYRFAFNHMNNNIHQQKLGRFKPSPTLRGNLNIMLSHTFTPLEVSLHKMDPRSEEAAVQIFASVMSYMGDNRKFLQLDKSVVNPDFLANRENFRQLTFARHILKKGIELEGFRDEIYLQLLKQTHNNPRSASVRKGWQLMSLCAGSFAPSKRFLPFVRAHVKDYATLDEEDAEVVRMAMHCERRLEKTLLVGPRKEVPLPIEISADRSCLPIMFPIFLLDKEGNRVEFALEAGTTARDLCQHVASFMKLGTAEGDTSTLFEFDPDREQQRNFSGMRVIDDNTRVLDVVALWDPEGEVTDPLDFDSRLVWKRNPPSGT